MRQIITFFLFSFFVHSLSGQSKNKFVFGIEGQFLEVKPNIRKNITSIPISENSYAFRTNIGYYFPQKRITFLGGIGYKNTNHLIGGNFDVVYSEENAVTNLDGTLSIVYEVPFYTVFGNANLGIALLANQNQRNFRGGDDVRMTVSIKNNVRWLYIPLSIQYKVIDRKKVDVFIKAGSFLNFIQKRSISQKQISISNLFIRSGATDITYSIPQAKITVPPVKFIPEVFLGGGLEIQIAPRFYILGSLEFITMTKPFYEDEILTTSFNSIGFSIGGMVKL